jgi:hypothetical protein
MTAGDFRRIALGLAGAIEASHMGHPDFRVNGRIFATIHEPPKTGMVKLTPEQQQGFVREDPAAFAPAAGAWGRQGCTRVQFRDADEQLAGEALTLAWQNAVNKPKTRTRKRSRR